MADPDGPGRHSFTAQQQTLRRLNTVFTAFFDRVRATDEAGEGKQPGYPRVKAYQRFSQVLFIAGDGAKWQPSGSGKWAHATFQAVGTLKVHQHRPVRGTVEALQLKLEHRRNRRRDFHHKTTRALVNQCDVIALEKLNTAGMTRRPAPRPDPGTPGAFLPNQFASILTGKAAEADRRVVLVNPAGTSVGCHRCGRRCERPQQKTVICPVHGPIDADVNGARNIAFRAGLGSGQAPTAA